jgi:hypothetical protein
VFTADPVIV